MRIPPRISLLLLLLGLLLCLSILFRSYLFEYLVQPVAILFMYLWRVIQSVHQGVYWGILLFFALIYASYQVFFHRLQRPAVREEARPSGANATLENIRYWRTMISVTQDEVEQANILKRELREMLASMLAFKQPGCSTAEMYKALRLHQVLLPENIYAFLFPEESALPRRSFKRALQAIWDAPRRWIGKRNDRKVAEYHRSIEQVIAYMESCMEIENDSEPIEPFKY
jgi:hypothetical protein